MSGPGESEVSASECNEQTGYMRVDGVVQLWASGPCVRLQVSGPCGSGRGDGRDLRRGEGRQVDRIGEGHWRGEEREIGSEGATTRSRCMATGEWW